MEKGDKTWNESKRQRLTRGFDDSETWSLDATIAKFIVPRLERFIEIYKDFVDDSENHYVPKMEQALEAFKMYTDDTDLFNEENYNKMMAGVKAFAEIFPELWW
jgi:hypothetical protein